MPQASAPNSFVRRNRDAEVEARLEEAEQRSFNLFRELFGETSLEDALTIVDSPRHEDEDDDAP